MALTSTRYSSSVRMLRSDLLVIAEFCCSMLVLITRTCDGKKRFDTGVDDGC